jgi:hypothetical protein
VRQQNIYNNIVANILYMSKSDIPKILITGTGRSGTTFLIKLFSFLGFNTGFDRENYKNFIFENCNSGMERNYSSEYDVLKNPAFIANIEEIYKNIKIKQVIIPIREYEKTASSRVFNQSSSINTNFVPGGLWNANNYDEQLAYYHKVMAEYVYYMTKYNINTIFLDFDKMISDEKYLFDKLKHIFDEKEISYELFCSVYDEVTANSAPKKVKDIEN